MTKHGQLLKQLKRAKSMRYCRTVLFEILPLAVVFCLPQLLRAEEGGGGLYVPGTYSSLLNITPNKPGFAVGDAFYFYTGDVAGNGTLAFGGLLATNINAHIYFNGVSLVYTACPTILGAHYTAAVTIPYIWVDVEAKATINPKLFARIIGTRTKTVRDSASGVTDMALVPIALHWPFGELQLN